MEQQMEPKVMKEHTLLSTDDAQVWAQEFIRIFNGQTIGGESGETSRAVDEGLMITWFANAIETGKGVARDRRPVHIGTWYAFLHFYHMDCANAAMHTASVRYSPITFRLAEFLLDQYPVAPHPDQAEHGLMMREDHRIREVMGHAGAYEEDKGR